MISRITNIAELKESVNVLKESFGTVAKEFHLTKKNCPANSAFIELRDLEKQFSQEIEFYQ